MADPRHVLGAAGEAQAAAHLKALGYTLLERNLRGEAGEIDIVARDPHGALVFVEVRTRRGSSARDAALESVDAVKRQRLARAVAGYLAQHTADAQGDVRIDVIAVAPSRAGRLRVVAHLPNAIDASAP